MVRVRRTGTGDLATIGVCPACWNIPERRADLLVQLGKMGLEVAHRDDRPGAPTGRASPTPPAAATPACRAIPGSASPWPARLCRAGQSRARQGDARLRADFQLSGAGRDMASCSSRLDRLRM